jgi:adenosine deaminase
MLSELHRHLDGSMRAATLEELACERGLSVPADLAFFAGMGLDAALSRFGFTLSCLDTPDAVERVAREMCEDADEEGISTFEIRFAPQLHGGATGDFVDAALSGIDGRAGLLLCGLYGDPPDVLEALVDLAIPRPGVLGIDLAGGPSPAHDWSLAAYAAPYARAAKAGLGRTVHAGEGRPPEEIRVAIDVLGAQRIGHGTTLLEDPDVVDLVRSRGVTLEACPTSNWQVGILPSVNDHPLPRWLDLDLKVCVNTDNTLLSAVSAPEELERAARMPGMTDAKVSRLLECGREAGFRR